ncbi:MAG: ATP-dependent helicase [Verrucomicrobiota bacterium]|nr:ATP-dependent helicase [Verrucomicrobiota bacterium]
MDSEWMEGQDPDSISSPWAVPLGTGAIDYANELNAEQYAAVTAPSGPALVLAGAGSGKTRTLTYRVAYLIERGVRPWQILLLTFTNKAAKEMLRRVEELTGGNFNSSWGGTFHSVGARFLRMHGDRIGLQKNFTILDSDESESLLDSIMKSEDLAFTKNKDNPKKGPIHDCISFARNTRRPLDEIILEKFPWGTDLIVPIRRFAAAYQQGKMDRQVTDYDDLLELWLKLFKEHADVRQKYQRQFEHILVDEYQDTNSLQSAIIDLIADRHQVMAVGDDAQCIYTWRGADFANIASFETRHPGASIYKIEVNYRSTPQILHLANQVLRNQPGGTAYHKELRAVREKGMKPCLLPLLDSQQQGIFIAKRIKAMQDEGIGLSEIAILYRAHYHALDVQLELTKRGIPFVITSGMKFFELAHIKDLIAQLRFIVNPADSLAFERFAILFPKLGEKSAQRLHAQILTTALKKNKTPVAVMSDPVIVDKVPGDNEAEWKQLAMSLAETELAFRGPPAPPPQAAQVDLFGRPGGPVIAPEPYQPAPPCEIIRLLIEGWYGDYMRTAYKDWQNRKDDLEGLVSFANRYEDMSEFLAQLSLMGGETTNRSVELDKETVRLTTIHQAKGLEYHAVFLIGLADGMFPLRRSIESGDFDEERRLFYVGVTRARDELYLCYPSVTLSNGMANRNNPSRFLQELPSDSYKLVRLQASAW